MPSDPPPDRVGLSPSPLEVLASAVSRVADRMEEICPPLSSAGPERATAYLWTLRSKLEEVLRGRAAEPIRDWLAANALCDPLLEALQRELLAASFDDGTASSTLAVLRACAAVRPSRSERPAVREESEDLKSVMRGAGAFDLLVEVAHDFRSPLTSILFLAEALRDGHSGPVTDLQRSQLGLVYSAAFGLAAIAQDVMDLARREQDLIGREAQPFALMEVFQSVERMVRPIVEEKGLTLRVVVPDRWQSTGHPHALSRILLNLTTNALKFTDQGSVEIGVRPVPHGRLEYYVQDTGRGITAEQQKALFQPFRRRPGSTQDGHYFSGSGIGLQIARRLLRAMGSDLALDSSDERGTRFSFVLPLGTR